MGYGMDEYEEGEWGDDIEYSEHQAEMAERARCRTTPEKLTTKPKKVGGSKVTCKCKYCKEEFQARTADRKRGWALFCSKSCKAKQQSKF